MLTNLTNLLTNSLKVTIYIVDALVIVYGLYVYLCKQRPIYLPYFLPREALMAKERVRGGGVLFFPRCTKAMYVHVYLSKNRGGLLLSYWKGPWGRGLLLEKILYMYLTLIRL